MVLWFSLMDMVELSHAKAFNVKKAKVKGPSESIFTLH